MVWDRREFCVAIVSLAVVDAALDLRCVLSIREFVLESVPNNIRLADVSVDRFLTRSILDTLRIVLECRVYSMRLELQRLTYR